MAYKIQFENGHTVEFESQPADSDIEEAFAHTQKLPAKTKQASVPEAYIGEDGRRYIKSVDKPSTPSFGDMFTKEVDDFFGTAEAAANLVTGGIAQGTGLIGGGAEYLRKKFSGEPTSFEKEYADSMQRQTFEPRGESGQEKAAAIGKFFNDVGIPLAGHGAIGPTLASGKPVPQTKKPPTANKTVEAIRAAQEAKKAETVAGEDPAVIELAKQRAAEMQAKAQARPITVDSSGNAALDATKGPFVREDPMTRMVRELGGEPLPRETVTPDNAITRMAEDLTSEKTPESVWKAQEELDARQRALEESVVAARKQDEAITDVSHRRMGPEDTTPSTGQFSLENFKRAPISNRGSLNRQRGALDPMFMKDGYRSLLKAVSKLTDRLNVDEVWQRGMTRAFGGEYLKNEDGSPMVMLHGTTRDIVGDIRATEQGIHLGTPGSAHHFVTNPSKTGSKATFSSDRVRRNGQIYPMVLKEGNYPKVEVDVGDWTPTRILQKDSPAERAVVDVVTAELIDKGHTPSQVEGLFNFVRNQTGTKARNQAWMDVLKRAGIDGFFYRNTAESPRSGKSFDIAGGYSGLSFKKGAMPFEHPYSFVTWDASKVKSVFDTHGVEPGSLGAYDVFKFGPGSEAGFRERFAKSGLGKKQGGAINLWQTPDPNSPLGKLLSARERIKANNSKIEHLEKAIDENSRKFWLEHSISDGEFRAKQEDLIAQKIDLEQMNRKWKETLPPQREAEIHPGYTKIPLGTEVLTDRRGDLERATVRENRQVQFGDETTWYPRVEFWDGEKKRLTPQDIKKVFGKSQRGSINLWSTPDPDSIVGRISRAFKEEGVDLIDQNLIPPNPELQSVIDTAKAEGPKGDGKFIKNLQSGSTSVAMKTRSPLLLAGSRIGQNALKMTDIHVRNYVMPAENAIRKLSKEDIQTLHEVMLKESRDREMFDKDVLAEHLNPDQLIAYDLIRKMQENQLEQVNAARKEKGLEPVDAHEAYLASRWQGDFRRPVYQKVGENDRKLVWYLASDTKFGLARETKNLLKYAEENGIKDLIVDESLDHQVHTSRNRTDLETAYSTMIDLLGRDDPAVKAMAELVEQAKAAEAYNAFGTKKHFENKAGIRGFVGDRPWKNPQKEAIAAFEEQFQQSKNAYSWAFTQKAVDGITKLASDPDLVKMQPKNVAFLRDYAKTLMGMSETKLAKALDDSFRSTGISPKLIQQGVGNLKSYFILTKLGASVGNMVVNTLQTANIPSYLSQMVGAGYRGNPITSIATGMFGGIMMATAHYTPKTSRAMIPDGFLREAVDYAEANGVTARSIVDEAPVGSSKTIAGKAVRAIGHTLSGPETLARSIAFMSYAKMLESSGKFTKEQWPQMFQLAEEYTNKSMVDYRQTEHAMIYGKGGTIGKALNVLQTYPMSFWNQYSFMAREAAKGNPWGLLTMLPTHYLLAGVAGIPAVEALDKLYKLVKDNLLSTETWAELNESPFWRDPKAWLIDQMGQGYYGKLSVDTGINWTSRLGAPGPESMVTAPGGAAVELFEQGLAVGKAALDPTNSTKWAQAGMKTVPVALQGLLEQSGAMKDHTYVVKPETGERVYQKNTDLAAREGQYNRSPEEEKIRNFGLRSQKEVMTRDMMYSASREVKLGQQKAAELPDRIYDAARRGDQQKANTLAALYMSISKEPNAGATLEEALKRATIAEYTTTEQKAALSIKESVNKAIAYARARKALESVK